MKKILIFGSFMIANFMIAQFKVTVNIPQNYTASEAYMYTLDGSKDILVSKELSKNDKFAFSYPKNYSGMMKIYFPQTNESLNFISENRDVQIAISSENNKIKNITYLDEANNFMNNAQDRQRKREQILPALFQIMEYYNPQTDFGKALQKETDMLSQDVAIDKDKYPFVFYYLTNYEKFLIKKGGQPEPSKEVITQFLNNSNEYLERSSLLKPILISFLNTTTGETMDQEIDQLLAKVNIETPRGQTILSEFIDIFDSYGMNDKKNQYLGKAKNLKCTINDRLSSTIEANKNTEIGAVFKNYHFINAKNTNAKSIYDVKADKKIIVFWASTCSHCEKELPLILEKYNALKAQKIEVIALSMDSDKNSYLDKTKSLPWINDSELKGWYSSYSDSYNVHATPTYFILDAKNKIIAKPNNVQEVLAFLNLK